MTDSVGTVLEGEITLAYRGERHFSASAGAGGGLPGALSFAEIHRVNGDVEPIRSKGVVRCVKGDRLVLQSAGGGYGDPRARSRSAIARDIADGKVTRTQAEQSYMNS